VTNLFVHVYVVVCMQDAKFKRIHACNVYIGYNNVQRFLTRIFEVSNFTMQHSKVHNIVIVYLKVAVGLLFIGPPRSTTIFFIRDWELGLENACSFNLDSMLASSK